MLKPVFSGTPLESFFLPPVVPDWFCSENTDEDKKWGPRKNNASQGMTWPGDLPFWAW
jgi:hypothetical protein